MGKGLNSATKCEGICKFTTMWGCKHGCVQIYRQRQKHKERCVCMCLQEMCVNMVDFLMYTTACNIQSFLCVYFVSGQVNGKAIEF